MPKKIPDYFSQFAEDERRIVQKTEKHFSKGLQFYKESFNMLFHSLKLISKSYSEKWSPSKRAAFFLLPRIIMSIKTSLDLLIRGYYFDNVVVGRSLMESVALLALVSKDEATAEKWLNFEKLELPKWRLIHHLHPSPNREVMALANKSYAEQSDFVHSSFTAIITEFSRHLSQRKKYLQIPQFKKSLIGLGIDVPMSLPVLLILMDLYEEELEKSFIKRIRDLVWKKYFEWKDKGA